MIKLETEEIRNTFKLLLVFLDTDLWETSQDDFKDAFRPGIISACDDVKALMDRIIKKVETEGPEPQKDVKQ
ncbi:hypothetical protein HNP92_001225 [Methanococcus maripaludis]|uniref:Uncharacterized protein n=1 Tax=Methanococcus maripaludis TaxID=39152 RepID=A0A7J9S6K2_METMI|nr:hypothetical protein [Methanococcus maripaludis]MBB6401920.1 hypothetical protein [Methanococcus maripaludis]